MLFQISCGKFSSISFVLFVVIVFRPSDPSPVFSHFGVTDSLVTSAVFVPHSKKSCYEKTILSWQNQSELYFINKDQELLTVSLKDDDEKTKTQDDVVSIKIV